MFEDIRIFSIATTITRLAYANTLCAKRKINHNKDETSKKDKWRFVRFIKQNLNFYAFSVKI